MTHECHNEDRIIKLEVHAEHREEKLESVEARILQLDENIHLLCVNLTQINSILSTLKWVLGILIALFGSILYFLVSGLIKVL